MHEVLTRILFNGDARGMICKVVNYDDVSGLYIYRNQLGNYGYKSKEFILNNIIE